MAATHAANPEAVPLYVIAAGVAMTVITFLSARIFVFLRMFNVGYAVAFCAFAVGFIVFGTGGLPDWAPGWVQTMQPKPFLALAFTMLAAAILVRSRGCR